jgi:hypothetical protein
MDQHETQENELQALALTKDFDTVLSEVDESASNEEEGGFHSVYDGIKAGINGTSRKCWAFQIGNDPLPDFHEGLFGFLLGESFEEVKARITKLPDGSIE